MQVLHNPAKSQTDLNENISSLVLYFEFLNINLFLKNRLSDATT